MLNNRKNSLKVKNRYLYLNRKQIKEQRKEKTETMNHNDCNLVGGMDEQNKKKTMRIFHNFKLMIWKKDLVSVFIFR